MSNYIQFGHFGQIESKQADKVKNMSTGENTSE